MALSSKDRSTFYADFLSFRTFWAQLHIENRSILCELDGFWFFLSKLQNAVAGKVHKAFENTEKKGRFQWRVNKKTAKMAWLRLCYAQGYVNIKKAEGFPSLFKAKDKRGFSVAVVWDEWYTRLNKSVPAEGNLYAGKDGRVF
ncbi:MAG: hypothetical protein ACSW8E_02355 [Clostridia bacterium]